MDVYRVVIQCPNTGEAVATRRGRLPVDGYVRPAKFFAAHTD